MAGEYNEWGDLQGAINANTANDDPWGSLSGSGNSDPSWDSSYSPDADNIDAGGGWNPATGGTGTPTEDYDFYKSIGIDPNSLSSFKDSPSNQQILKDIGYTGTDFTPAGVGNFLKGLVSKPGGGLDIAKLIALGGGALAMTKSNNQTQPSGYQGKIPKYTATRQAPGIGQLLSGNVTYATPEGAVVNPNSLAPATAVAPTVAKATGGALQSGGFVIPADVVSHLGNGSSEAGLRLLAQRYGATPIKGKGDGMSDSIKTTIDGRQPARVANEEAQLTAAQVKAAGGAQKLYAMMDKIRQARTGSKKQGKQINPNKFMPGGTVQSYVNGGTTSLPAGTTGTESSLSNWAGDYVTNMLGKGQALSEMPYEQYKGPLTAGPSALQTQAFGTAANLQTPASIGQATNTAGGIATAAQNLNYKPVGSDFGTEQAQQYMNPYLKAALDPQMAELQRQNQIANMAANSKLTGAGAFGGGRQAIMNTENQRNMLDTMNKALGQGYSTAYDKAMSQFNADQQRKAQEAQFGSTFGLQGLQTGLQAAQTQGQLGTQQNQVDLANLGAQAGLGATQQGLEQADIAAQKAAFEEARLNPFKMVQFQQSLLSGLPLAAQTYNKAPTDNLTQFSNAATTLDKLLKNLGQ